MLSEKEINDKIDEWHAGDGSGMPLYEYLGMSQEEYRRFVENPSEYFSDEAYGMITQNLKNEMDDLFQKAFLSLGPDGMNLSFEIWNEDAKFLKEYQDQFDRDINSLDEYKRLTQETLAEDLYES
jgi:hypothetical protein